MVSTVRTIGTTAVGGQYSQDNWHYSCWWSVQSGQFALQLLVVSTVRTIGTTAVGGQYSQDNWHYSCWWSVQSRQLALQLLVVSTVRTIGTTAVGSQYSHDDFCTHIRIKRSKELVDYRVTKVEVDNGCG